MTKKSKTTNQEVLGLCVIITILAFLFPVTAKWIILAITLMAFKGVSELEKK